MGINIPENIQSLVDEEFCRQMVKELHIIFGISMETFYDDVISVIEGTQGWETAFISTCRKCSKGMVYQYYSTLGWAGSEQFNNWLSGRMLKIHLFMEGTEKEAVTEFIGNKEENIHFCMDAKQYCGLNTCKKDGIPSGMLVKCKENRINYDIHAILKKKLNIGDESYFVCKQCHKACWNMVKEGDTCLLCSMGDDNSKYFEEECRKNKEFKQFLRV